MKFKFANFLRWIFGIGYGLSLASTIALLAISFRWQPIIHTAVLDIGAYPSGIWIDIDLTVDYWPPTFHLEDGTWIMDRAEHHALGFGWGIPYVNMSRRCHFGIPWWFIILFIGILCVRTWRNISQRSTRPQGFVIEGNSNTDLALSCAPKMTPPDGIDFSAKKGRKSDEEAIHGRTDRIDSAGSRIG
jgi:hypothetical protein